jgi:hypothetical protein
MPADAPVQSQYQVAVGWVDVSSASLPDGQSVDPVIVGDFTIPSRLTALPTEATVLHAPLENSLTLVGYTLAYSATAQVPTVDLHVFWQTQVTLTESYHVFVHWLDADGHLIAQSDGVPGANRYPTHKWLPGEIVEDVFHLASTEPVTRQPTHFAVGMYRWPSGQRLTVTGPHAKDNTVVFSPTEP